MDTREAFELFHHEFEADDGLDCLFRMSADVEPERLERFLEALSVMAEYYEDKAVVEKDVAFKVISFRDTLSASAGHWKVSRPKGMTIQATTALILAFSRIFAS